jgi:hypothetical protein
MDCTSIFSGKNGEGHTCALCLMGQVCELQQSLVRSSERRRLAKCQSALQSGTLPIKPIKPSLKKVQIRG